MDAHSIRLATAEDLPAINDIYNYYVQHSTCTFQLEPETAEDRRKWFDAHGERHPVTVADVAGEVVGWGSLSKYHQRAAYQNSAEASVYVHHEHLGRRLGRVLLVNLIERAKQLGYHTLIGGACTEQAASMKLQAALGFQPAAHFREVGFKFGRWLDVDYMQLML